MASPAFFFSFHLFFFQFCGMPDHLGHFGCKYVSNKKYIAFEGNIQLIFLSEVLIWFLLLPADDPGRVIIHSSLRYTCNQKYGSGLFLSHSFRLDFSAAICRDVLFRKLIHISKALVSYRQFASLSCAPYLDVCPSLESRWEWEWRVSTK